MAGWSGDLNVERPFGHDAARGTDEAKVGRALRSLLLPTTRNDVGRRCARGMTKVELKAGLQTGPLLDEVTAEEEGCRAVPGARQMAQNVAGVGAGLGLVGLCKVESDCARFCPGRGERR